MLYYCKKCGRIVDLDSFMPNFKEECDRCHSMVYKVPEEYWLDGCDFIMDPDKEEEFIEKYITSQPGFDQDFADRKRIEAEIRTRQYEAAIEEGKAIMAGRDKGNPYGVECPYCHATNVKRITLTSKAVHTAVFGVFSAGRNSKQYHCSHCGADF